MMAVSSNLTESIFDYDSNTRGNVVNILGKLLPHDCINMQKSRYGRLYDGGYVMAEDFDGVSTAFSLGINDDVSWDIDMAAKGIGIFQYDHTINNLPESHLLFNWEKVGISAESGINGFKTIKEIVEEKASDIDHDLILKCDVEGHEWEIFANTSTIIIARFRQIVVEFHSLSLLANIDCANLIRKAVNNLTSMHHVIHVHANNWAPWTILGGIPVPTVLEITFLRKDRGVFHPSEEDFPTSLDMPCRPDRPDYLLGRFRFK